MNPKYLPTTVDGKTVRVVEESGEVVEVIGRCLRIFGKIGRFGLDSTSPGGGPNNAAMFLSELADLRHAISQVENSLTDIARIKVGNSELVWTNDLVPAKELRELYDGEDMTDEEFLSSYKMIAVCDGQWHREGLEYRFFVDPERVDG
ncbi:hypothetical protein [Bradyrhizobium sp. DASA03007]|uniref:hypothetical protein n=1 Tax=unclassified Bradyrhizobium TaxID=2631580 RepID=UPI003F6FA2D0